MSNLIYFIQIPMPLDIEHRSDLEAAMRDKGWRCFEACGLKAAFISEYEDDEGNCEYDFDDFYGDAVACLTDLGINTAQCVIDEREYHGVGNL